MNNDSFDKGTAFENYLQNKIFPESHYDLLHKTHSIEQNAQRFVENTLDPDFKFRSRKTGMNFYVEAKYRSRFFDDKLQIMDLAQFHRFEELDQSGIPVLVAIGYEGTANRPNAISLIPISELKHLSLYESVLKKYDIDRYSSFPSAELRRLTAKIATPATPSTPTSDTQTLPEIKRKGYAKLIAAAIVITVFGIWATNKYIRRDDDLRIPTTEAVVSSEGLKNRIVSYYAALENNNYEVLDYYINDPVGRWFNQYNVSLAYIKKDTRRYLNKYPMRKIKIDWNSYKSFELPNGDHDVFYKLNYEINGQNGKPPKNFYLAIKSIWSKDLKIKSIYEERLKE